MSAIKRDNLTTESLSSKRAVLSPSSVAITCWARSKLKSESLLKPVLMKKQRQIFVKRRIKKCQQQQKKNWVNSFFLNTKKKKKKNAREVVWWWSWGVTFTHVTAAVVRSLKQHSVTTVHTATPVTFTLHQAGLTSRGRKRQIANRQETASN